MAFVSNNFSALKKIKLEKTGFSVECNVAVNEGEEVLKILSLSTDIGEERTELLSGELIMSGKIAVEALYLTLSGEVGSVFSACPFTAKAESPYLTPSAKVDTNLKVVDCKADGITGGNLRVGVMLETAPVVTCNQELRCLREGSADICTKEEEIEVISLIGENKASINAENEFTLKENIKKVLLSEHSVTVRDVTPGINFVTVSGEIFTKFLYVTESDKFESSQLSTSFKEEIEFENITRECAVEGFVKIRKCDAKTNIEPLDKGVKLILNLPLDITVRGYGESRVLVGADMYSLTNELEITMESYESASVLSPSIFETKIDGGLILNDNSPRIDKVLCNGGNRLTVSNSYVKEGEICIEGIAYTNVVYLNDEENSINSVEVEIPFVVSDKVNYDGELITSPSVALSDVDVAVKKGREILFDAKLRVAVNLARPNIGALITGAEMKGAFEERLHGIEIYFAKANQDVWDIAKELRVQAGIVAYQNPGVTFPLEKDENIVIFYQKSAR